MNLVNIGYIKRKMKPGTHEFIYFPSPLPQDSIDQALGSLTPEIKFLQLKISELKKIADSNKKGYTLLLTRLEETLQTFELYQKIIEVIQNPNLTIDINSKVESNKVSLEDLQFIEEDFAPELKEIENDILDFFIHQSKYLILKRFELISYVYFITRKVLTQEKLRKLTGLSLGKVSQVVKNLLATKFIEKIGKMELQRLLPKEKTFKIHYTMETIQKSFMKSGMDSLLKLLKWEEEFSKIHSELVKDKQKLKKLNGYEKILKKTNDLLRVIPIYKQAYDFFSKFVD